MTKRFTRDFFKQPTLLVAEQILGQKLVFYNHSGIITEVESYVGEEDPACHAAVGKTKRTEVMYGLAGLSYVYMIYGMYYCLNIVTEEKDFPAAILIRGVIMSDGHVLDGPGKLCKYMGINKIEHNNLDLTTHNNFYLENINAKVNFDKTTRIGISKGKDRLWRYILK